MRGAKVEKISLEGYGNFLGKKQGSFVVRDRNGNEKAYPLFENEIGEIRIASGNTISSGALATCGYWGINVLVLTQKGHPVAILKSLDDDSHVKTRVCQYQALANTKCFEIAKRIVIAKMESENQLLRKYGLKRLGYSYFDKVNKLEEGDFTRFRHKLNNIEGQAAMMYFSEIYQLFPELIRPKRRTGYKAYDAINNLFNLGYEFLSWKCHIALINANLEPYLGFLHTMKLGMPSLVCDLMEIYRFLIDAFIIEYCKNLRKKDFVFKTEKHMNRKGKREYLNDELTNEFTNELNKYFVSMVEIPRVNIGKKQEIETLISEEASLLARYLRNERTEWKPRVVPL
jgi:CRISPR-associated protein Cas1